MFFWRYRGLDIILRNEQERALVNEVTSDPEEVIGYYAIQETRNVLEKRMFKHLERLAKEDEEKFWRRFAFHSYYDSEASDAFPDILTAYFRATLRAMLVTPAMMDLSDVTNNFSAGDTAFYVAVFPRWPRILWQCGIRPKRTALLVFPQNSITKLAGTVPHFFIGLRHGKIAFRPDRVDFVSYELDR